MPGLGKRAQNRVCVEDRRRHQFWGLTAGIAKHHALIAGTLVLVARGVDSLGDVSRLPVDQTFDGGVPPMEVFLLVADIANGVSRHLGQLLSSDRIWAANFSG